LGCWCAASLSLATAQQVEFPLEFYSFAEIAQRMSVDGRRIECARDLRQRLALIQLQPRAWQQTRELLEKALDVRFRKISDAENRWVVERDPEVARVERQRRERLANYLDKEGFTELRLVQILLDKSIPTEQALETAERLVPEASLTEEQRKEALQFIQLARELPLEPALRNWRAYKRLSLRVDSALRENNAEQTLAELSLSELGFSAAELQWAEQAAQGKDEKWRPLISRGRPQSENPAIAKVQTLLFLGMFAEAYLVTYTVNTLLQQLQPPVRAQDAIEQGIIVRVHDLALPPELAAWIHNDVGGSRVPFGATEPVSVRLLSIAEWGKWNYEYHLTFEPLSVERTQVGSFPSIPRLSAFLELAPNSALKTFRRFDSELAQAYQSAYERHTQLLQDPSVRAPLNVSTRSFAYALREWAHAQRAELIAEVYPESQFGNRGNTLSERLASVREPYLLERHETVWVVRHWAAFVQRVPDLPLAAIRDLQRTKGAYTDWRTFYQAITPEQARWLRVEGYSYPPQFTRRTEQEGYPTCEALGNAWLVMTLLEQLPPALRTQLWDYADDEKPLIVGLATLPANAKIQLARTLDRWRATLMRTPQRERLFSEDSAALVERLALRREASGWALYLPQLPSDPEAFPEQMLVWTTAPCPLPLRYDAIPQQLADEP